MKSAGFSRFGAGAAALGLLLGGCSQPTHVLPAAAADTQPTTVVAAASQPAPPIATVTLPLAPVPATFDVAVLAERVKPMVVNITTMQERSRGEGVDPFEFFFGPQGPFGGGNPQVPREKIQRRSALGTGFIIDPSGYVITNEHVVNGADDVQVRLADDRDFKANVVGRDPKLDIALLKLIGASNLPAAPLGNSEQLRVGEHVLAVGNPFGLGHTVTLGIVSAKARTIGAGPYDDFIQTDASINPGNSGGPLFNWRGEVVGINSAIRAGANGIGFAIPVDALKDILPQLREKGYVERGKLGLLFQPMTSDLGKALGLDTPAGALVAEVEAGGPAARAGLKPGDVVIEVNGTPIQHAEELPRNVARNPPGTQIKVTVLRNKQRLELAPTLEPLLDDSMPPVRPDRPTPNTQPNSDKLGITISDAAGGGVRVDGFTTGSTVDELLPGDVITDFNGTPVRNVSELRAAVAKVKGGTTVLLKIRRGKTTRFAALPIPR